MLPHFYSPLGEWLPGLPFGGHVKAKGIARPADASVAENGTAKVFSVFCILPIFLNRFFCFNSFSRYIRYDPKGEMV